MDNRQARIAADLVLVSAAVAVGYLVITIPSLRRLAIRATRLWLGASLPMYLVRETSRAWAVSGRAADMESDRTADIMMT